MNDQELLDRIRELEEENAALREKIPVSKTLRPICPDWIGEKYGGKKLRAGHFITSLSFMTGSELADVSKLIRRVCFPKEEQMRKLIHNTSKARAQTVVRVDDLTDEQYEKYCEVLDAVIGILAKNANKENG